MKKFWNNLVGRFRRKRIRQLPWGVLGILVGMALVSFIWSILQTGDWAGAAMNFSTEMAGAAVTYLLLVVYLGTKQEKERLIANMGSSIRDVAVPAADELKRQGWLFNGSLKEAKLAGANLYEAYLRGANLQGADLRLANLAGAQLLGAHLQGADLRFANLEGAELESADISGANLQSANLKGAIAIFANSKGSQFQEAIYTTDTIWPGGFDPVAAGAILVEDKQEKPYD
jgi:hypothetical protein